MSRHGTIAMAALLMWSLGCTREPVQTWMIGDFSSREPGPTSRTTFERYRFVEGGDVEVELVDLGGVRLAWERTWEPDGTDAFFMFPGDGDDANTQEHRSWRIARTDACERLEQNIYYDGVDKDPDHFGHIYRGKLCVRDLPGECTDEEVECDTAEFYWCEPPSCEENS